MINVILRSPFTWQGAKMHIARMPRHMTDGDLALTRLTIFAGPSIKTMFHNIDIATMRGAGRSSSASWVSLWWSLRSIFPLIYCVKCGRKRAGLIGLYDLKIGESASMSLIISDRDLRRKGYGGRAFRLLRQSLEKHRFIETIFVEVETDNHGSLSFWQKLGFAIDRSIGKKITLSLSLSKIPRFCR